MANDASKTLLPCRQVLVVGGGNAAHVLAALGSHLGHKMHILTTFQDEAERWREAHDVAGGTTVRLSDGRELTGQVAGFFKEPAEAARGSSLILFAVPAFSHQAYLELLAPFIEKGTLLGAMPGQGGFDFVARHVLGALFDELVLFALETLPWACRIGAGEYGRRVDVLSTKKVVDVAVSPASASPAVIAAVGSVIHAYSSLVQSVPAPASHGAVVEGARPELHFVGNILNCTLMNINSVWHPTITYGRYRAVEDLRTVSFETPPLFYEGVDKFTGDKLAAVSDEIRQLKQTLEDRYGIQLPGVRHVREWMQRSYEGEYDEGSDTLEAMIRTNKGYRGLTHPTVRGEDGRYRPNFGYRYISEDVPMGLMAIKGVFDLVGMPSPNVDEVLAFCFRAAGHEFQENNRRPQNYGFDTIDDLITKCRYRD